MKTFSRAENIVLKISYRNVSFMYTYEKLAFILFQRTPKPDIIKNQRAKKI